MENDLLRNGSGYIDTTAYKAIKNYQKGESKMEFNRGEIFEYELAGRSERKKALVVSADFRSEERYINIIVLIDEPKGQINVPIVCEGMMWADCGMVSFATNDRLGNFIKRATDAEMKQVDEGIIRSLGLEHKLVEVEKIVEVPVEKVVEVPVQIPGARPVPDELEYAAAKAEANVYKNLYEQLLARMIGGAV